MGYYLTSTPTSVTFHVSVISGRTYYRLFIRLSSETQVLHTINLPDQTSDFTYTVSGLTPGTSYTCNVGHFVDDPTAGGMVYMGGQSITTQTYPSYSLTATSDSVTFHVTPGLGYTLYMLYLRPEADPGNMIVSALPFDNVTAPFSYTVTGLNSGTAYSANVYYSTDWDTVEKIQLGAQTITTEGKARPSNWSWTTNVAKGAAVPKYGENLAPITAAEWNAFCGRINEFRQYKSMTAYSFTTVSKGTKMTAAIINQAITAINGISGHGTLPAPSNAILAEFWQQLASAMNAVS